MEGTKSWNGAEMMSRVHIGNTARLEKEDLRQAFEQFGTVTNVWIARNPPGFAFVTFSTPEEAEKAIREGNNMEIRDDRVSVELAHPRVGAAGFACAAVTGDHNVADVVGGVVHNSKTSFLPQYRGTVATYTKILPQFS